MQNSFVRLGNTLINQDHITYINKLKREDGQYYEVYVAGKDEAQWRFDESSIEGKSIKLWFDDLKYTYGNDQEA